ncbi:glycosyl hydrolase family 32 [Hymenobacter amundsenii]|uniref:Glycosyl hydrolase family 32 n=1 Tax=Hymenobacter amundsenii TaxID=2006685 RepID=A0A246FI77_9BACT|nr:glycoside hydrolase family 32 protein [Hymenobacter amundsenii]OWP62240.1 glycosyl hydrolase family 32 [Hymenobacter amundsenii]
MKSAFLLALGALALAACNPDTSRTTATTGNPVATDSATAAAPAATAVPPATPQYRPAYHFAPAAHWMNDPNGMVYLNGTYHLYFQYYPDGMVWGPMHWGHATSRDLVRWQEQPIALYPDSLGWIFSGSAVIDANNTAGFGKNAMVAIFTHHNDPEEKKHTNKHQYQSLAYSLDEGKTWTKYAGNPVLPNPGIQDFRDPKVSWHEASRQWVMTLATKDRITFYGSPNLKNWTKLSEFGEKVGAHGGVWECPDLFPLQLKGQTYWVLIVNLNPGAPNGGSGTQYFVGQFDGKTFTPRSTDTKWADYGPDDYAGVTWNNTPGRRIFLGWMSNWTYANQVPTSPWRNALTIPRELGLRQVGTDIRLTSEPVKELQQLAAAPTVLRNVAGQQTPTDLTSRLQMSSDKHRLTLSTEQLTDFELVLSNAAGEELVLGYNAGARAYFIDRSKAGQTDFNKEFASRSTAPRLTSAPGTALTLYFDAASVELFADEGLTVMTAIFFPTQPLTRVHLRSKPGITFQEISSADLVVKPVK